MRVKISRKYLLTGAIVLIAVAVVLLKYRDYIANPWTRDGQVRAEVIQITPRVSGPIVSLNIVDNQFVKTGTLLFEIDPRTFAASLAQAEAQYDNARDNYVALEKQVEAEAAQVEVSRAAVLQAESAIKEDDAEIDKNKAEFKRQQEMLAKEATSKKSMQRAKANYQVSLEQRKEAVAGLTQAKATLTQSEAALAKAKANLGAPGDDNASIREAQATLEQAELNLEFTRVKAPVDGYVTNLNLRIGSQAVTNQPALALVDTNSYWVDGFFKETLVEDIRKGNKAIVTLMSYPDTPLQGHVDSLGWGIAQQDGSTGFELLPNINPTFEWIRLAQRVPVRIHLVDVPDGVELRVGTTASVLVMTGDSDTDRSAPALPRALQ
jgi:multidrug resistance efflux pump